MTKREAQKVCAAIACRVPDVLCHIVSLYPETKYRYTVTARAHGCMAEVCSFLDLERVVTFLKVEE